MRTYLGVILTSALSLIACQTTAYAQFQEPTKEELQMTEDSAAPGAPAVILNREETTDDRVHVYTLYVRLKILTEKGKDLATVSVPYESDDFTVTGIRGRTIHSDGTVIPLTTKPSDLTDIRTKDYRHKTIVFTLPSVEVGSILEYRLQERYSDYWRYPPFWHVQQHYFVHTAHFTFKPDGTIAWIAHMGADAPKVHDHNGDYVLDIENVPPVPSEDWMPPIDTLTWMVRFYYTHDLSGDEFWKRAGKNWLDAVDSFAHPSGSIRDAAASLVAPGDSESVKARKIYDAVQSLENTSFTRYKTEAERKKEKLKEIKTAEDVWKQKSGNLNQIAQLYIALARGAGLKAYPMQVVDRDDELFDPSYLSLWQLDDFIVVVMIDDNPVYLDPGQKNCPFGHLHWKHQVAGGLRGTDKGAVLRETPAGTYKENEHDAVANLTIAADGSITGSVRLVLSGAEALHWRQLALSNDANEIKRQFDESVRGTLPDGVSADFDHFLGLDDYGSALIGILNVAGSLGASTGKHLFLPALFFESHALHPFVSEAGRKAPIDVHYPLIRQDDVTYHLPDGYTIESAPQDASVDWAAHAMLRVKTTITGNTVRVVRALAYNYTILDPKLYDDLRGFYQKVATADQQQLVLTKAAAAKGN